MANPQYLEWLLEPELGWVSPAPAHCPVSFLQGIMPSLLPHLGVP